VTLFPGLRHYAALRQVRVPADSGRVMGWLTDPDRREREWRRLVEAEDSVQQSSVGRLPNGGLRFDQVVLQGSRLLRHTTEDVAILEDQIDRVHCAHVEFARSRTLIPLRWVMQERVTVESLGDETSVTVRVRGQPAGLSRVLHLLGYRDTTMARHLEEEAARRADFRARGIAAEFTGPRNADASPGNAG
jgi:hypothetical protein